MNRVYPAFVVVLLGACLALSLSACGPEPKVPVDAGRALELVPEDQWPLLLDDLDAYSLTEAIDQSVAYLRRLPPDRLFTFGPRQVTAEQMARSLEQWRGLLFQLPSPAQRRAMLQRHFELYRSVGSDNQGRVLFTGYYEPVLEARRQIQSPFVHPLYAVPSDLVNINLRDFDPELPRRRLVGQVQGNKVKPYPERDAIDFEGAVDDKAEVLAWLADPVESFFLHIQGSGQVVFADGSRLRLGYAATNGRPYRSIGALLINEGLLPRDQVSMQSIQQFLVDNPGELRRVLGHNPSYVFFRPLSAEGGPLGCFNAPLTAGRSVATDRRIFPGAALGFISGQLPVPGGQPVEFSRFVLNQDTGGAIRGPGRLDLFFGSGYEAGQSAGRMKYPGSLYFFAPRE
jgi:membrane-bound lytic murein transglycosylase A